MNSSLPIHPFPSVRHGVLNLLRLLDDSLYDHFGPIRLLFVIKNIVGYRHVLPLIREVVKRKEFKVALTLEKTGCFTFPKDEESRFLMNCHLVGTDTALRRKWHYVILTDRTTLYFKRHATIVQVGHGMAGGNVNLENGSDFQAIPYFVITALQEYVSLVMAASKNGFHLIRQQQGQKYKSRKKEILVTGAIKSDTLVSSYPHGPSREEIIEKNNLMRFRKIVFIYSHWKPPALLNNLSDKEIERLCLEYPNYAFLVAGHPLLWLDHDGTDRRNPLFDSLIILSQRVNNLVFLPIGSDHSGMAKAADYFIGDSSSFFVEACIINRPILFFDNPCFRFEDAMVERLFKNASTTFTNIEELISSLATVISNPDHHQIARKKVADYFTYQPGNVVNYIVKSLLTMGRVSGPRSRSWIRIRRYCEQERRAMGLGLEESDNHYIPSSR